MERPVSRKPRHHFETASAPTHVTFDDGRIRRNMPWPHYIEGRWDHQEPSVIRLLFSEWHVVITGYSLGPLFAAIEERVLLRVQAQPDCERTPGCEADTVVTHIVFMKPMGLDLSPRRNAAPQLDLGLGG